MFISKSCKMLRGLSYWASNALIVYVIIVSLNQSSSQQIYNIGGIFSNADAQRTFENAVTIANAYPESHGLGSVRLNYSTGMLHKDPVRCMKEICSQLINNTVYLVITDRLVNNTRPPYIVSYACNFYNIPVIGVASRETQFTDKVFSRWAFASTILTCMFTLIMASNHSFNRITWNASFNLLKLGRNV